MMKLRGNISLWTIIVVFTVFFSCKKNNADEIFAEKASVRLQATLDTLQKKLSAAPGWRLFVYPQGLNQLGIQVGGISYYVKFTADNRVQMVSDFLFSQTNNPKESSWRLKAMQAPSLLFDTYNYITIPCDPDWFVNQSPVNAHGFGWGSDYNFQFTTVQPADTIYLKGNFNYSPAVLIKASESEMDSVFNKNGLANIMQATFNYEAANHFLNFNAGNQVVGVNFDFNLYLATFFYLNNSGVLEYVDIPYSHYLYGVRLQKPFSLNGVSFQDLLYDAAAKQYSFKHQGLPVFIKNAATPVFSLHQSLGKVYKTIQVPAQPPALAGQSSLFLSEIALVKQDLLSIYNIQLVQTDFSFSADDKQMDINFYIKKDGDEYVMQVNYSYELNATGQLVFNKIGENINAAQAATVLLPVTRYFNSKAAFTAAYFKDGNILLGQLKSVFYPGFYFTGIL